MSDFVSEAANNITARAASRNVKVDPILIITVIQAVLSCLNRNDDVDPDEMQSRVQAMHNKNPKRLHKRTKVNVKQEYRQAGDRISDKEASILADEMIDEMLYAPPQFANDCCAMALAKDAV